MLNSVPAPDPATTAAAPPSAPRRTRLTHDDRRRQLLGIGLSKLVDKPIQHLSIDEVAAEAGISRGLLFHYFPTKRDFYLACIEAAGRRILRNTEADPALPPRAQVESMVRLFVEQIDRRRQLVGIGLAKNVETPIQDLSMDDIATEAGISRGLLFHYFATKRDFYRACIEAAGRRILRNTEPDPELPPRAQVESMVRLFVEQIDRRRAFYLSLLHGTGTADVSLVEVYDAIWDQATTRVVTALALEPATRPVVHAWWAYVEDQALSWSADPVRRRTRTLEELVVHCVAALDALLDLA
jgi:AcrR family transcriptional regulator